MSHARAQAALDAALRGDPHDLDVVNRELSAENTASAAAWTSRIAAARWLAGGETTLPDVAPLLALEGAEARRVASLGCHDLVTAAALQFDSEAMDRALTAQRALCDDDPRARLALVLSETWREIARGNAVDVDTLKQAERTAAERGHAKMVVRAASLLALGLSHEHLDDAVNEARRASRMARAEGFPHEEYLAHVVLARTRRLAGRPYLATRILTSLQRYTPSPWHRWLRWEIRMASGSSFDVTPDEDPWANELCNCLAAARDGDLDRWQERMLALRERTSVWPLAARDSERVAAALDPDATPQGDDLEAWRRGELDVPPHGLLGLEGGTGLGAAAYVLIGHEAPPCRLLGSGTALARQRHNAATVQEIRRRQARVDRMLAVLACAPEGLSVPDVFRAVWGFRFAPTVHTQAFEITVHRCRDRLGAQGVLHRDDGALRLEVQAPLLVPDPRCTPEADERVLQYVAGRREVTARDAAKALGISLRGVQAALSTLVEGGACKREKRGRQVAYAVEDTTFREPTVF